MILFARHGDTNFNNPPERFRAWTNISLNAKGQREAERLGQKILKAHPHVQWDSVIASSLDRTSDTGEAIAKAIKPESFTRTGALLPWHLGELTGKVVKDTLPALRRYIAMPDRPIPGGESLNSYVIRTVNFMTCLLASGDNAVVVGHSRTIRLISAWMELGMQGYSFDPGVFGASADRVPPGGFCVVKD